MTIPPWIRLDNTANLWPAIFNNRATSIFRLETELDHIIRADLAQRALADVLPNFPFFQAQVRPGLFWYMLERRQDIPLIQKDVVNPCMNPSFIGKGTWPFRIRVHGNIIAGEFSHLLTDGMGALNFMHQLVNRYIELLKTEGDFVPFVTKAPDYSEWEDPSRSRARDRVPVPPEPDHAMHLPYKLAKPGYYRITHAFMPTDAVLSLAKERGLTLTEYLCSLLMVSIQSHALAWLQSRQLKKLGPIRIIIPINLRGAFKVNTLRNFYAFASPEIDPRMGTHSFDEICSTVMYTLRRQVQTTALLQQMSRNVLEERGIFKRIAPLFLKNLVISMVYTFRGDKLYTLSLSNLGKAPIMESGREHIVSWRFIAPPNPVQKTNLNIISHGNKLCLTFSSLIADTTLEREVLTALSAAGVPITIISNKETLEAMV